MNDISNLPTDQPQHTPELLDALKAARWYVARSIHLTSLGVMKRDRDLADIDAVIAKAEGRS